MSSRVPNLSNNFPFLWLPILSFLRLLQAFFRHPHQHGSILKLISLTFASSTIILSTLPVGTSTLSAAQSTAAFHQTRHMSTIWAAHSTRLASSQFTPNSFKLLSLAIPIRKAQGSYCHPRLRSYHPLHTLLVVQSCLQH